MEIKERLPILAAFKKAVSAAYDAAKEELEQGMDAGDRKTLTVNGEKSGSASLAEGRNKVSVHDPRALKEWCEDNDVLYTVSLPSSYWGKGGFLTIDGNALVTRDGEIVPGVYVEKGEPYLSIKGCEPEKVLPMVTPELFLEAISEERRLHD